MPTNTYTPLANVILTGSQSAVTFSSISSSYAHLVLIVNGETSGATSLYMRLNNDTTTQDFRRAITGYNGSVQASSNYADGYGYQGISGAANTTFSTIIQFPFYTRTDRQRHYLVRNLYPLADTEFSGHNWRSASAIHTIRFYTSGATFNAGTEFALYGIVG